MSCLLLGVDGGATKTIALIADASGAVLGAGRSGSSDIHDEGSLEVAVANVMTSVREAAAEAGLQPRDVDASVFGLCGADWPEDVAFYADSLSKQLGLTTAPVVTNDAFNSLRAGTPDGLGVALVMGTGGAVAARGPSGETWFSGERMESAGASEFGRQVYDRIIRGEYGSGPRPAFGPAALEAYGAESVEAMVYAITRTSGLGRRSLARLAPVLLEASHAGDSEASRIVREQGELLAGYVRRAAKRVGLGDGGWPVVLAGGVLKHHGTELRAAIVAAIPGHAVELALVEPVHGAILMAADHCGVHPDRERLVASGPGAPFFDTR